jgi:sorbitol-specific phosphotransferase system component IIC
MFFGFINLIITIAVMELFTDRLMNTAIQMNEHYGIALSNTFDKADLLQFTYLVGWSFAFLPAGMIAGWFIRLYRQSGGLPYWSITGLVLLLASLLTIIFFISPGMFSSRVTSSALVIALMVAIVLAALVGLMTRDEAEGFPYHNSDWFGYLIGYMILGGTQVVMGVVAFALPATLIGIVNIPHLINGEFVDQAPVNQVSTYFGVQTAVTAAAMLLTAVFALIIVNLVSFSRSFLDIRETYHPLEDDYRELE